MAVDATCSVDGCDRAVTAKSARAMCPMHYKRLMKWGDPSRGRLGPPVCSVGDCGSRAHAHKLCRKHLQRMERLGTTELMTVADRFWPSVERAEADECWPWVGHRHRTGYGHISLAGHGWSHRLAWELANGPIPDSLLVLHRCDNPPCCNPAHLFLGTHADNMRDMIAKGRGWWQKPSSSSG